MSAERKDDILVYQEQTADQLNAESWDERWQQGRHGFHLSYIHTLLEPHVDLLENGRKEIKIFFPMCGKSLDMKWLADRGHQVTGVEFSETAIKTFFEEQSIDYTKHSIDGINDCVLYKSKDELIQIYQCDIFNIKSSVLGQFDAVWDRGAFSAIMIKERQKYSEIIMSLMNPNTRYLLVTVKYDITVTTAPPYAIPAEIVKDFFDEKCNVELIREKDSLREFWIKKGHKYYTEMLYLITLKT